MQNGGSLRLTNLLFALGMPVALGCLAANAQLELPGVVSLFVLGLIQITPMAIAFIRGRFTFLEFVLISHFVTFTVARLNVLLNLEKGSLMTGEVILAVEVLTRCTLLIIFCHSVFRFLVFRRFFQEVRYEPLTISPMRYVAMLGGLLVLPFVAPFLPGSIIVPIFSSSAVIFIILFTSKVPGREKLLAWGQALLLISAVNFFLQTGFMTLLVQYAGVMFIYTCLQRKVIQLVALLLFAVLLSAVQSVKADFRTFLLWNGGATSAERANTMSQLLLARYGGESNLEGSERDRELSRGFSRLGDTSLETVLSQTPSIVPYWNGETYESIPFMFIPRFLWPDKPSRAFWNKYGHLYGILSEEDMETSVGVGILAEAYMNYGYVGLYAFCLFFGAFVVFVERVSVFFMRGPTLVAYMVFLIPIMPYSTDFGGMVNSVFLACFALFGVRTVFISNSMKRDAYGGAVD